MNQNLDPVSALSAVAAVLLGPAVAEIIGAYAVIVLAATAGAAWSLGSRPPNARWNAVGYFGLICITALLVTVNVADLIGGWLNTEDTRWLLAPIALVIGGVGHAWPRVGRWVIVSAGRIFMRRHGGM